MGEAEDHINHDDECSETEMKDVAYAALSLLGGIVFVGVGLVVILI